MESAESPLLLSLLPSFVLDAIVNRALEEDLGGGDVTTDACIDPGSRGVADATARGEVVVCGGQVFAHVFRAIDADVTVDPLVPDGTRVAARTTLWKVRGPSRALLKGERTALNLTQRMTGIATVTRRYVDALPAGSTTRITDTRKTMPGLRALDRYAVRAGGGKNHRDDLGSAVLLKDNHLAACGGVRPAIARAREYAPHTSRIECEVDTLEQLDEALDAGADIVLLDNMDDAKVAEAVRRVRAHAAAGRGRVLTEASGGITLARVAALATLGVDAISVGALTHSVVAADIGLDWA
jgi:nicotinate-nucleotide pyrophosphorylase (carboxylating)